MRTKLKYSPARLSTPVDYEDILPLATVKSHLRMDHDDDDNIIAIYRDAAMRTAEHETQRRVGNDSYVFYIDQLPADNEYITIPVLPVQTVDTIKYHNGTDWQTIDPSNYILDEVSEPARIKFLNTDFDIDEDKPMPVEITITGGYDIDTVPREFINGALLMIGHLYENRQDVIVGTISTEMPKSSQFLFQQLRVIY